MIKLAGAAVLVLSFAVSAQAQSRRVARFTGSTPSYSGGGGGGGGVSSGGSRALPHFPPTRFAVRNVTGNTSDYIPSSFVTFQAALAEGKAELAERPEPIYAHGTDKSAQKSAKIEVVQGQSGKPALQTN